MPAWPAGRDALDREDVEALGGCVHGGREAGGPGAHDDEIVDLGGIDRRVEAGAVRELGERGVRTILAFAPDHDRCGRGGHVELAEQRLGAFVGLEVEEFERDTVPTREFAEAVRVGRKARADNLDAFEALAEKQRPPREERLEDDVAELGILVDRLPERGGTQLQDLAVPGDARRHEGDASGEHVDVAGELLGLVHRHGMGDAARMLDDLDRAVEHNVEGEAAVPFREEDVACLDVADAGAGTEQIDLGVGQLWKRGFSFGRHGGRSWAGLVLVRPPEAGWDEGSHQS